MGANNEIAHVKAHIFERERKTREPEIEPTGERKGIAHENGSVLAFSGRKKIFSSFQLFPWPPSLSGGGSEPTTKKKYWPIDEMPGPETSSPLLTVRFLRQPEALTLRRETFLCFFSRFIFLSLFQPVVSSGLSQNLKISPKSR